MYHGEAVPPPTAKVASVCGDEAMIGDHQRQPQAAYSSHRRTAKRMMSGMPFKAPKMHTYTENRWFASEERDD